MEKLNLDKPVIFFDLETTGTDINTDRVVQIAAIKIYPDGAREEKNLMVNPTIPIPKEASDVHGITNDMVADLPIFDKYAVGIQSFFTDCHIGGYNSNRFDMPMLLQELRRSGLSLDLDGIALIDVMQIETKLNPRTLSAVYQRYTGKVLEDAHDALADVRATVEILENQLFSEELTNIVDCTDLDKFSQGDNVRVDVSGKLCMVDGQVCWNFGKNKNRPILEDKGYLKWYLKQSVPVDTMDIINNLLNS